MVKFTFGPDGVAIEEDLNKLVKIIRALIKSGLTDKSKKSLKRLLREITKIYNMIVKRVSPFYDMNSDVKFKRSFGPSYRKFKENYLKGEVSGLKYSCDKVKSELDNFMQKRQDGTWYDKLRDIFRTEKGQLKKTVNLTELDNLIHEWFAVDRRVYSAMQALQVELNQGLDEVNTMFSSRAVVTRSRKQLQIFLKDAEPRFRRIQTKQTELKTLSAEL